MRNFSLILTSSLALGSLLACEGASYQHAKPRSETQNQLEAQPAVTSPKPEEESQPAIEMTDPSQNFQLKPVEEK